MATAPTSSSATGLVDPRLIEPATDHHPEAPETVASSESRPAAVPPGLAHRPAPGNSPALDQQVAWLRKLESAPTVLTQRQRPVERSAVNNSSQSQQVLLVDEREQEALDALRVTVQQKAAAAKAVEDNHEMLRRARELEDQFQKLNGTVASLRPKRGDNEKANAKEKRAELLKGVKWVLILLVLYPPAALAYVAVQGGRAAYKSHCLREAKKQLALTESERSGSPAIQTLTEHLEAVAKLDDFQDRLQRLEVPPGTSIVDAIVEQRMRVRNAALIEHGGICDNLVEGSALREPQNRAELRTFRGDLTTAIALGDTGRLGQVLRDFAAKYGNERTPDGQPRSRRIFEVGSAFGASGFTVAPETGAVVDTVAARPVELAAGRAVEIATPAVSTSGARESRHRGPADNAADVGDGDGDGSIVRVRAERLTPEEVAGESPGSADIIDADLLDDRPVDGGPSAPAAPTAATRTPAAPASPEFGPTFFTP